METPIPTTQDVTSWPQALVAVVTILAVVALPSFLAYRANTRAKTAAATGEAALTTLTQTNGGSTVKDSLNRIEDTLADTLLRLVGLEDRFADHLASGSDSSTPGVIGQEDVPLGGLGTRVAEDLTDRE